MAAIIDFVDEGPRRPRAFRMHERLGLTMGALALGAGAGFALTLGLGQLRPWMAAACAAPLYFAMLLLTADSARDALARKEWTAGLELSALLAVLMAWPLAVFYSAPGSQLFWTGPLLSLALIAGLALTSLRESATMIRLSAVAALAAVLAVNQSLLVVFGA